MQECPPPAKKVPQKTQNEVAKFFRASILEMLWSTRIQETSFVDKKVVNKIRPQSAKSYTPPQIATMIIDRIDVKSLY